MPQKGLQPDNSWPPATTHARPHTRAHTLAQVSALDSGNSCLMVSVEHAAIPTLHVGPQQLVVGTWQELKLVGNRVPEGELANVPRNLGGVIIAPGGGYLVEMPTIRVR